MAEEAKQSGLQKKLLAALSTMPNPVRDTKGYGYTYAQLDQVLDIAQEHLATCGLGIRQGSRKTDFGLLVTKSKSSVDVEVINWGHELYTLVFDDTDELELDSRLLIESPDAQIKGSYETYQRRYGLLTACGLAAEDDDGQATVQGAQMASKAVSDTGRINPLTRSKPAPQGGSKASQSASPNPNPKRFEKIGELKAACLEAGIKEEGLRSWLATNFIFADGSPKPMAQFSDSEIADTERFFEQLLRDKQALSNPEIADEDIKF